MLIMALRVCQGHKHNQHDKIIEAMIVDNCTGCSDEGRIGGTFSFRHRANI